LRKKNKYDYYPGGMPMPGRTFNSSEYRYGFQGQEKDDEIKGEGNSINYKYRMHDPRIGRFFAVDPLSDKYPYMSTYQFAGNKPSSRGFAIRAIMPKEDLKNKSLTEKWVNNLSSILNNA